MLSYSVHQEFGPSRDSLSLPYYIWDLSWMIQRLESMKALSLTCLAVGAGVSSAPRFLHEPLLIIFPLGLVWASSELAGCVPKVSVPRFPGGSHINFYNPALVDTQCHLCCTLFLITKSCPGSREAEVDSPTDQE